MDNILKGNQAKQIINFFVFTENIDLYKWVDASLKLGNLPVNNVSHCTTKKLNCDFIDDKDINVFIADEFIYPRLLSKIKTVFSLSQYNFSILVLTGSTASKNIKTLSLATIDFVPWDSLTVFLFEHLINSLIRDFEQNQILQNLAHYDPLTKAANRRLFDDRGNQIVKRSKRHKEPLTLILFDLDDFKIVNDTFGHEIGDLLLIKFTEIVDKCKRDTDTLARLGGDEFALLLPNTSSESSKIIIDKIISSLSKEYIVKNNKILIKASVGAVSVIVQNSSNLNFQSIIKSADMAVYEAKKVTGTSVHYVPPL
jgi:diguanylate cyclase (GGDEF)-like protein